MLHTKNTARPTENALKLFRQPVPAAAPPPPTPHQHQSHGPNPPSILLYPMTPPSQPHALALVRPQKMHLLHQKKSMSNTAPYSQLCPLNLQYRLISFT